MLYSFGREEQLERNTLARLLRSISRVLEPEQALSADGPDDLRFISARPCGGGSCSITSGEPWASTTRSGGGRGAPLLGHDRAMLFALVANSCLAPTSKLAACA